MSQTLNLQNFPTKNIVAQTQLTAAAAPSASNLTVANAEDFTSQYLLVGTAGSNTAELLPNTSVTSGTSIALTSNTVLQHNQYEPVYALFGNQIRIYRAADAGLGQQPADTSFALLSTVTIDPASEKTVYTDSSGGGGYWYKATFYNPGNNNETDLASSRAVRGSFTVNYVSLDEIRREAGFKYAPYVTDDQIDEARQAAQDEINGALDEFYQTPFQPPISDQIRRIAKRLATGYLRQAQFSQYSDPKVNGKEIVHEVEKELQMLVKKERVVVDKEGKNLAQVGGSGEASGWPDAATLTTASSSGGAPRVFRMGDIQGQPKTIDSSGNPVGNLYYGRKW